MMRAIILVFGAAASLAAQGAMQEVGKENLPAQKLGVDDLVAVSVYDAPELTRTVRVESDGGIRLPLLEGSIPAAGSLPRELEQRIAEALKAQQIMVDPIVKVTVVEYHSRPIAVMGAVKKPLTFQAVGTVTLLDALARAEGFTEQAGTEILLTRPGGKIEHIAMNQLIGAADPSVNFLLHGGEQIRVPEARKVVVVGNVHKPGAFPVRDNTENSVLNMVAQAEGLLPFSAKQAYVYRKDASGVRKEITVELARILDRKSPDFPLEPDDVLYIPDNKGKRLTLTVVDRLTGFGSSVGSGLIIWH